MALGFDKDGNAWQEERPIQRRLRRWTVNMQASVLIGGTWVACRVRDISPGGARIQLASFEKVAAGDLIELELPEYPTIKAEVRYRSEGALGLQFLHDAAAEIELGRYLVARHPQRHDPRVKLNVTAVLRTSRSEESCTVIDISRMGARLQVGDASVLNLEQEVVLSIDNYGEVAATIRRIDGDEIGLRFRNALLGALPS